MKLFVLILSLCLIIGLPIQAAPQFKHVSPQQQAYWAPPRGFVQVAANWTPPPEYKWTAQAWAPPKGWQGPTTPWQPPAGWGQPPDWAPPGEF